MRTLERNKIDFWVVNEIGRTENIDEDGYFTGEEIPVYSVPKKIRISVYPVTEEIRNRVFGLDLNLDLVAIAGKDEVQLNENSLLFLNEPKMSNISSDKIYYLKDGEIKVEDVNTVLDIDDILYLYSEEYESINYSYDSGNLNSNTITDVNFKYNENGELSLLSYMITSTNDYLSRSYDYSIQSIKESLNINRYGLKKKV